MIGEPRKQHERRVGEHSHPMTPKWPNISVSSGGQYWYVLIDGLIGLAAATGLLSCAESPPPSLGRQCWICTRCYIFGCGRVAQSGNKNQGSAVFNSMQQCMKFKMTATLPVAIVPGRVCTVTVGRINRRKPRVGHVASQSQMLYPLIPISIKKKKEFTRLPRHQAESLPPLRDARWEASKPISYYRTQPTLFFPVLLIPVIGWRTRAGRRRKQQREPRRRKTRTPTEAPQMKTPTPRTSRTIRCPSCQVRRLLSQHLPSAADQNKCPALLISR